MNNLSGVYRMVKSKISNDKAAYRLRMSLAEYRRQKDIVLQLLHTLSPTIDNKIIEILDNYDPAKPIAFSVNAEEEVSKITEMHANMEEGTAKLTAISSVEPKTPEQIIDLLKIDTSRWKLSQYWNKEKNGYWQISALVTQLPLEVQVEQDFLEILRYHEFPEYTPVTPVNLLENLAAGRVNTAGVISLQDLHFGKPGNENMGEVVKNVLLDLCSKAVHNYRMEKMYFVVGGDLLNMDTFSGTTTKGTIVENADTAVETYLKAYNAMYEAILLLRQMCDEVNVVFIPGNHDRLSSYHLVHALSHAMAKEPGVLFNVNYEERKAMTYGINMFCFEHGDVAKKTTPLVYATEFSELWGKTAYRTLFTGHYHKRKTTEYVTENEEHGFSIKILPSLSASDYYHYHNKFTGAKRAGVLELYGEYDGKVAEFNSII
jgi:hypothetical protein